LSPGASPPPVSTPIFFKAMWLYAKLLWFSRVRQSCSFAR
jgi:hypothetical protein